MTAGSGRWRETAPGARADGTGESMGAAPGGKVRRLEGKRAFVTGGGRGIGRAVALELAREGADVAVAARSAAQTGEVAAQVRAHGVRGIDLQADVTDAAAVDRLLAEALRQLGGVDILVNCAGDAESNLLERTDAAMWHRMLAVNLTSVFLCTRAALPGMKKQGWGRIINIASRAGLVGYAYVCAYTAAKHGVVGFTRSVGLELAGSGVTINAVCPGQVDTEMTRSAAQRIASRTGAPLGDVLARLAALNPSGELLSAEAVERAAMLLALPEAGDVNGQAVEL